MTYLMVTTWKSIGLGKFLLHKLRSQRNLYPDFFAYINAFENLYSMSRAIKISKGWENVKRSTQKFINFNFMNTQNIELCDQQTYKMYIYFLIIHYITIHMQQPISDLYVWHWSVDFASVPFTWVWLCRPALSFVQYKQLISFDL